MGTVLGLVLDLGVDGSVLVLSKCLDNQLCFAPKHLGSVLVWNKLIDLNRVLENLENLQYRVKSGKFGHQVNSDIHLQTVEIQMSRLIRIFTVCLVNLFFYSNNLNMKQTRSLSQFT